ncbi:phosphatase PAP2 family protein [bacterium]|nr:phosphatase PAP2 family protein [bacterium]
MQTTILQPVCLFRKRYKDIHLQLMDYTIISYLIILAILTIIFHHIVIQWRIYPVVHFLLIILILELIRWSNNHSSKILHFLRTFYPALGLGFFWTELNNLITMIFPYWANDFVVNLDLAIFRVHPTVWVQNIFTPWLTELMNFFYAFYYFFIPIGALTLYCRGRKQETFDFLFLVFFTYCAVFLTFLFFPAEGPWIILKDLHTIQPRGGFFLRLNQFIQGRGSIKGGCFPSSHVAAAYTLLWASFKYQWKVGLFLFPFVFGMATATVYCQYHHAVDALSGMILGTILYGFGILILKKWHKKNHARLSVS